jgi:hypothetical protein
MQEWRCDPAGEISAVRGRHKAHNEYLALREERH